MPNSEDSSSRVLLPSGVKKQKQNNTNNCFLFLLASVMFCSAQSQDSLAARDSPVPAAEVGEETPRSGPSFRSIHAVSHSKVTVEQNLLFVVCLAGMLR